MFQESKLRSIEILPEVYDRVKDNICMVMARLDPRLNNVSIEELIEHTSSLQAMNIISRGTGFLISAGYVVTAYHVVENACRIDCLTPQGEK